MYTVAHVNTCHLNEIDETIEMYKKENQNNFKGK